MTDQHQPARAQATQPFGVLLILAGLAALIYEVGYKYLVMGDTMPPRTWLVSAAGIIAALLGAVLL